MILEFEEKMTFREFEEQFFEKNIMHISNRFIGLKSKDLDAFVLIHVFIYFICF